MSKQDSRPELGTARLEAFSDGVLAIVMTLLVLDLHTPAAGTRHLANFLADQWPTYVAYLASFLVIGTIWLNHHAVLALIRRSDHGVRVLNLLLLAAVSVIPFPTALLADFATGSHARADALTAVVVYGGVMMVVSIAFNALWRRIRSHPELRHPGIGIDSLRTRHRRFNAGLALYPAVTLLGLVDIRAFVAGIFLVALLYLLPTEDAT